MTNAAAALGVSRKTLSAILNGRAGISPEMAVRLSMAFGTSAESWMNQQVQYDLWHAERRRKEFKVTRLVPAMPPVELYTPERIAEFERETQLDVGRQVRGPAI